MSKTIENKVVSFRPEFLQALLKRPYIANRLAQFADPSSLRFAFIDQVEDNGAIHAKIVPVDKDGKYHPECEINLGTATPSVATKEVPEFTNP